MTDNYLMTELQVRKERITKNLKTFYEVGADLMWIKDSGAYKEEGFKTFEKFCQETWGMERRHAYRLIDASKVQDNLCPIGHILPETESQARILTKFNDDDQRTIWGKVINKNVH